MKLKDYKNAAIFRKLYYSMGIIELQSIPKIDFSRTVTRTVYVTKIEPKEQQTLIKLKGTGVEIVDSDITVRSDELLEIDGRKHCAYIRDQRTSINPHLKTSGYRYHLANCKTLQQMRSHDREHRYLAKIQNSEIFEARDISTPENTKHSLHMKLCMHCIGILKSKKMYTHPFDIQKFFEQYNSDTPRTIRVAEVVTETQTYTPDAQEISKAYRERANYTCSICQVNCSQHPHLTHLHHINGDKTCNLHHNLAVLCVDCHSMQPLHSQMTSNQYFQKHIELIKRLRQEQGI